MSGDWRLDRVQNAAGLGVEAHLGVGEADVGDHFARQLRNVHVGGGGDFAGHHADAGGDQRLRRPRGPWDRLSVTASSTASEI